MGIFQYLIILFLNFLFINLSSDIDVEQLYNELLHIFSVEISRNMLYLIISLSTTFITFLMLLLFKPFIEIYLLHYFKFSFFLLINLFSISSVFIVLRIYGYSRLYLLAYILLSSFVMFYFEKIINRLS